VWARLCLIWAKNPHGCLGRDPEPPMGDGGARTDHEVSGGVGADKVGGGSRWAWHKEPGVGVWQGCGRVENEVVRLWYGRAWCGEAGEAMQGWGLREETLGLHSRSEGAWDHLTRIVVPGLVALWWRPWERMKIRRLRTGGGKWC
jgi:hypothetical protein